MSLLLGLYRGFSAVSEPLWRAALTRRLNRGREDPARWREKLGYPTTARPDGPVLWVEIEAVHSGQSRRIAWRELRDAAVWRQGWV